MLVAVVQASFALVIRSESRAMVDQAARSLAREHPDPQEIMVELRQALRAVSGDASPDVGFVMGPSASVTARFEWTPPGPGWGSVPITIKSNAVRVVRP